MEYKLKVYSIWEDGQRVDSQGKPHQEDNLYPKFGEQSDTDRLFILCDGMGGHDAGEVASATVCEAMSQSILNDGHDKDGVFTQEDLTNALDAAFTALDKKDSGAEKKMGTTMTFLKLHSCGATIAHMGDSRVYQIRPGKTGDDTEILFETEDHSLVNDLIKVSELTREEARFSKQKNVITRAMQPNMGRRPKADVYNTVDIKPGDYFYMCSDGMLEQPEMENGSSLKNVFSEMGGSDENKIEILKSVTEKNRDNHTAFIIHITDVIDPIETETHVKVKPESEKFTAIVEGEEDSQSALDLPLPAQVDETAAEESTEKSVARSNKDTAIPVPPAVKNGKPVQKSSGNGSKIKPALVRFILVAAVVLAAIVVVKSIKSCSADKDDEVLKEVLEQKYNEKGNGIQEPTKLPATVSNPKRRPAEGDANTGSNGNDNAGESGSRPAHESPESGEQGSTAPQPANTNAADNPAPPAPVAPASVAPVPAVPASASTDAPSGVVKQVSALASGADDDDTVESDEDKAKRHIQKASNE